MNTDISQFGFKRMVSAWTAFTVLLAIAGVLVFVAARALDFPYESNARSFAISLNIVNILLFSCFYAFRNNTERFLARLVRESDKRQVSIEYRNEAAMGLVLGSLLVVSGIYVAYLVFFDIEAYFSLIREDGYVEYLSALFWFLSAAVLVLQAVKSLKEESGKYSFLFGALFVAFFIVCGGEEISWGQRLTGHETPGWLKAVNVQEETTLHNIGSISVFSNMFFLLTFVLFLILPYVAKRNPRVRNMLDAIRFPIPHGFATLIYAGSLAVWILVGLRFGTLGFHPFTIYAEKYYTQMDDEIFELLAAYSFFCFSLFHSMRTVSISAPIARPAA